MGANARWSFDNKHLVFGLHGFGGSGSGRYGGRRLGRCLGSCQRNAGPDPQFSGPDYSRMARTEASTFTECGRGIRQPRGRFRPVPQQGCGLRISGVQQFKVLGRDSASQRHRILARSLGSCTSDTWTLIKGTAGFCNCFYNGTKGRFQLAHSTPT